MSNRLVKSTIIVMIGTSVSLVVNFARHIIFAGLFGATAATDAYMMAFFVPYQLQSFLIAGVLMAAFIPIFVESLTNEQRAQSWELVNTVLNLIFMLFAFITAIGVVGAPWLVKLIAPGFTSNTRELAISLTRIMFPVVIVLGLAGVSGSVLNSLQHFAAPAFSPGVFGLVFILSLFTLGRKFGIVGIAWGTLLAGLCQLLIQIPPLFKAGFRYRPVLRLRHPALANMVKLAVPLFLRLLVIQIYLVVLRILASQLAEGSVSAFEYAQRVSLVPAQALGAAIPIVIFPALSMQVTEGKSGKFVNLISSGITKLLVLLVPVSILMMILAVPLIRLLFQRGAFDVQATALTARALFYFSVGLFAYPVVWLLNRAFFALQNAVVPLIVASICSLLAAGLSVFLAAPLGVGGLALSYSMSSILQVISLLIVLKQKFRDFGVASLFKNLGQVAVAGIAMGPVCWLIAYRLGLFGEGLNVSQQILYLGMSSLTGLMIYLVVLLALGNQEIVSIWNEAICQPLGRYVQPLDSERRPLR